MTLLEHQFNPTLKMMSVVYKWKDTENVEILVKCASDAILPLLEVYEGRRLGKPTISLELGNTKISTF